MSVIAVAQVSVRPFSGFVDPGLPVGFWFATAQALGDASAGLNSVAFRFQDTGAPAPSLYWSLEQLNINISDPNVQNCRLQIANMDNVPGSLNFAINFALNLTTFDLGGGAAILTRDLAFLPLFLGNPVDNGLSSGLQIDVDNTLAATVTAKVQGYFWGARSVTSPGGLRRPIDGLYAR